MPWSGKEREGPKGAVATTTSRRRGLQGKALAAASRWRRLQGKGKPSGRRRMRRRPVATGQGAAVAEWSHGCGGLGFGGDSCGDSCFLGHDPIV
jgi:hypothetical protein